MDVLQATEKRRQVRQQELDSQKNSAGEEKGDAALLLTSRQ